MLPSIMVRDLENALGDFLKTTFPISNPHFSQLWDNFFQDRKRFFRGPYFSIKMPFRVGDDPSGFLYPIEFPYKAHLHQVKAFERLCGDKPRSTLIATGTGSGKTECFLYPILRHCFLKNLIKGGKSRGIKAILIYPMNALAADQAARIDTILQNNGDLRDNIRVGLYVGQGKGEGAKKQTQSSLIVTDRDLLRTHPPDILLTNYKMLDLLLLRGQDYELWSLDNPGTLKYLVVDEIHSFDGAQGTDLALLIRRLKGRLEIKPGGLCCIGTSATLGSENERTPMAKYASDIFGEPFTEQDFILEERISEWDFLKDSEFQKLKLEGEEENSDFPPFSDLEKKNGGTGLEADGSETILDVVEAAALILLKMKDPAPTKIARALLRHPFLPRILTSLGGQPCGLSELILELNRANQDFAILSENLKEQIILSFLALISFARNPLHGMETQPFLQVRGDLWFKELVRVVSPVSDKPEILFSEELSAGKGRKHLPLLHCRDCGEMGWVGLRRGEESLINGDLKDLYPKFFALHPDTTLIFPRGEGDSIDHSQAGKNGGFFNHSQAGKNGEFFSICSECLFLSDPEIKSNSCLNCGEKEKISVFIPDNKVAIKNGVQGRHDCPFCEAESGLTILGSRSTSLSSVVIGRLFASRFNPDKKLLAFSDSVQDSAHRAGFFSSRTFQFNFRGAVQQWLLQADGKVNLAEGAGKLRDFYLEKWGTEKYFSHFFPPDLEWLEDFEAFRNSRGVMGSPSLSDKAFDRLRFDLYSEYAYRAEIGRTLEKSGCSMVMVSERKLLEAIEFLHPRLENFSGSMRNLSKESLGGYLLGLIQKIKNSGGIFFDFFASYLQDGGNTFHWNRTHIFPVFYPGGRKANFVAEARGSSFPMLLNPSGKKPSWFEIHARKGIGSEEVLFLSLLHNFFPLVFNSLVSLDILKVQDFKGKKIWGLNPKTLEFSLHLASFRCSRCGWKQNFPDYVNPFIIGSPCLRHHCSGVYQLAMEGGSFYRNFYSNSDLNRVRSSEHTGLLEGEVRERVETSFKSEGESRTPWDLNLLACTPTLEMGIHIGDLSSLILCSVPPDPSNYVQRVGRAGRRDGNSLAITVAGMKPHDLYFFETPEEMVNGKIEPPGVFLSAERVLERQLFAYAMDSWVKISHSEARIPKTLGDILNKIGTDNPTGFPWNFLHFLDNNRELILEAFFGFFSQGTLFPETLNSLRDHLLGGGEIEGSLKFRIIRSLEQQKNLLDSWRKKIKALNLQIKAMNQKTIRDNLFEQEIGAIDNQHSALKSFSTTLKKRNPLNWMTDEGLLPNYAFPEEGVILKSVITRKVALKKGNGDKPYELMTYNFERSATQALSEFAPWNSFYAGGRKVTIDQVDMDSCEVENWRFCSECSYSTLDEKTKTEFENLCPECQATGWGDNGQRRPLMRIRHVTATTKDRISRIGDSAENRDPKFYHREILTRFKTDQILQSYVANSDQTPFGYEWIQKAEFREINFGEKALPGEQVRINGQTSSRAGFTLCKHCGKVQEPGKEKIDHTPICPSRKPESEKNLVSIVYLYREFSSEALRLLLPMLAEEGEEWSLESFIAGFFLGLKGKFGGNISHLKAASQEEPIPGTKNRKKYLIIYDSVPGGTGYLKQLAEKPDFLIEIFRIAREILINCQCYGDENRDGCYRCLLSYYNSREMEKISARRAIDLFSEIIKIGQNLVPLETGLKQVDCHALLESELERKFFTLLRVRASKPPGMEFQNHVFSNGKTGKLLKIGKKCYTIEPQCELGPRDGVRIPVRPDFIFRPEGGGAERAIAVFTDGFEHHRDRIGEDLLQRAALVQSGQFFIWSLSYEDVQNSFPNHSASHFYQYLDFNKLPSGKTFQVLLENYLMKENFQNAHSLNPFEHFLKFLENPQPPESRKGKRDLSWKFYAHILSQCFFNPALIGQISTLDRIHSRIQDLFGEEILDFWKGDYNDSYYGDFENPVLEGEPVFRAFFQIPRKDLEENVSENIKMLFLLGDSEDEKSSPNFKGCWNGFIRLFNYFQFLPGVIFSTTGIKNPEELIPPLHGGPEKVLSGQWSALMEECPYPELKPLIRELCRIGAPLPESGIEFQDEKGVVIAMAELFWRENKIALFTSENPENQLVFTREGIRAFPFTPGCPFAWEELCDQFVNRRLLNVGPT